MYRRTWEGPVGILGVPTPMDGGGVTASKLGTWTEEGLVAENVDVPPDIVVAFSGWGLRLCDSPWPTR